MCGTKFQEKIFARAHWLRARDQKSIWVTSNLANFLNFQTFSNMHINVIYGWKTGIWHFLATKMSKLLSCKILWLARTCTRCYQSQKSKMTSRKKIVSYLTTQNIVIYEYWHFFSKKSEVENFIVWIFRFWKFSFNINHKWQKKLLKIGKNG